MHQGTCEDTGILFAARVETLHLSSVPPWVEGLSSLIVFQPFRNNTTYPDLMMVLNLPAHRSECVAACMMIYMNSDEPSRTASWHPLFIGIILNPYSSSCLTDILLSFYFKHIISLPSPLQFLLKNQLTTLWEFPCMLSVAFPLLLLISSTFNCCHFDYSMSWCILLWVYPVWNSLCFLWVTVSFPRLGKFSAILSSNIFSGPLSLFSF